MIILGIDPGFSITGYGIMKKEKQTTSILDFGAVRFSSSHSLETRIGQFYETFSQKITEHQVSLIALETPFLGKNPQNFLKLGYLRGIIYLLAHQHKVPIAEFSPREVKLAITGSGAAQKEQVARVLARLFKGLEVPKTLDITDALAVTLCGVWKGPTRSFESII
jgi:crossover junction endodeoxyribonuclease RuvC